MIVFVKQDGLWKRNFDIYRQRIAGQCWAAARLDKFLPFPFLVRRWIKVLPEWKQ